MAARKRRGGKKPTVRGCKKRFKEGSKRRAKCLRKARG